MGRQPIPKQRTNYIYGFSGTMKKILEYEAQGLTRPDMTPLLGGLKKAQMSKGLRIYLTSLGVTPESGNIVVKNCAIDLVKKLDANEISLHKAEDIIVECVRRVTGLDRTISRASNTIQNPVQQLEAYFRAIATLEGICYGLEQLPDVFHSSITKEQREEIEMRLAKCRRVIERRINIIRKDNNGEQ